MNMEQITARIHSYLCDGVLQENMCPISSARPQAISRCQAREANQRWHGSDTGSNSEGKANNKKELEEKAGILELDESRPRCWSVLFLNALRQMHNHIFKKHVVSEAEGNLLWAKLEKELR